MSKKPPTAATDEAPSEPADAVVLPVRVACVDTGSNAIRFIAAEFTDRTRYTVLDADRAPVRLGHGVFLSGRLGGRAMEDALVAFRSYRERMDALGITHYRAVATSAVRESSNGSQFVARVGQEAGIELETITGSEEARLVHLAIRNRIRLGDAPWVLADLGGGSVEVSLVDETGILWSESHTMGSVRLLEELAGADEDPGRFRRVLTEYVSTLRIPHQPRKPAGFIATGGNIEALARLAGTPADTNGVVVLGVGALQTAIESLARLSFRQRVDELGLREDRADVILPGALVYERLAQLAGVDRIHVPGVGVKEGVLLDLIDDLTGHEDHEERLERDVITAAVNLGRRYFFDEDHGRKVAELSRSLFDQLEDVHGLPRGDRRILIAAALLHDIGSYISRKGHHRHSYYLISHSELSDLTPAEILMVATVSRFHRKREPAPEHEAMLALVPEDRHRTTVLAGLLRIADGLDREHRQVVRGIRVRSRKGRVRVEVDSDHDILLERVRLKRRGELLARTLGIDLEVRRDPGAA